ncbi:unnamed protein product [Strongylus vulgaris]|uniref:Uncharacterized protein n=1 Tax=Strongylus vulgaris TaxID=40348 RepID=A0A3P7JWX2_STRVU|nr:unnamed protein product [Strongylus vulgaris]
MVNSVAYGPEEGEDAEMSAKMKVIDNLGYG